MEFTIEQLDKVLEHKSIHSIKEVQDDEFFDRVRSFTVTGSDTWYRLVWWINMSYLYCGDVCIPFKYVKQSNTWPNEGKMNLQFYDSKDEICCILKIENY